MCRAAVSIASNIAEGRERDSNAEFIRFLNIAKASAAELRTQFYIAVEVGLIAREKQKKFIEEMKSVTKMIQALINSLRKINH